MAAHSRRSVQGIKDASPEPPELEIVVGIKQLAHEQILRHIERRFSGHALADLVGAVLAADGFHTQVSKPGPDGGVDVLASNGIYGLDEPRICVQVKSSKHPEDVVTLRALLGTMENFQAQQGILVAWGGFTKALASEARKFYFRIRLWSAKELVEEIYRTYDHLPESVRSELPLERIWVLDYTATG